MFMTGVQLISLDLSLHGLIKPFYEQYATITCSGAGKELRKEVGTTQRIMATPVRPFSAIHHPALIFVSCTARAHCSLAV